MKLDEITSAVPEYVMKLWDLIKEDEKHQQEELQQLLDKHGKEKFQQMRFRFGDEVSRAERLRDPEVPQAKKMLVLMGKLRRGTK